MSSDFKETTVSMVSGLAINYFLTLLLFGVTMKFAAGTTAIFFTCSFARCYAIRKYYRRRDNE